MSDLAPMQRREPATPVPSGQARFGMVRVERGRFLLECTEAGCVAGPIAAYVDGIPIGSSGDLKSVAKGAEVAVNCNRFPSVGMPCRVRFASGAGDVDLAPPFALSSAADAERLVGAGRVEQARVAVRNGVITGHGVNRVNGVARPFLLGRVNGELLREVRIAAPRPLEEGGASLDFTLAIEPGDLTESGAHYEILVLPEMTVLASLSFPRSDAGALAQAVARNEAMMENLSKRVYLEIARSSEQAERARVEQQQAVNTVAEYLIALVNDRFASRGAQAARDEREELVLFRKTVEEISRGTVALDYATAQPNSSYFADGWSWLEQDSKGFDFRWMGLGASVFNPQPQRPVSQIVVSVATTYRGVVPEIAAILDADEADVELFASPSGAPYTLKVLPRSDGKARLVQVLRLVSSKAGRPSEEEGTDDDRVLSMAVSGVVFYYGD